MDITPGIAVEHIVNSLDNEYGSWYDKDNKVTWHIGEVDDCLAITIIDEDDNEEIHKFKLVKQ